MRRGGKKKKGTFNSCFKKKSKKTITQKNTSVYAKWAEGWREIQGTQIKL